MESTGESTESTGGTTESTGGTDSDGTPTAGTAAFLAVGAIALVVGGGLFALKIVR